MTWFNRTSPYRLCRFLLDRMTQILTAKWGVLCGGLQTFPSKCTRTGKSIFCAPGASCFNYTVWPLWKLSPKQPVCRLLELCPIRRNGAFWVTGCKWLISNRMTWGAKGKVESQNKHIDLEMSSTGLLWALAHFVPSSWSLLIACSNCAVFRCVCFL